MDQGTIEVERFVYETDILLSSASCCREGVAVTLRVSVFVKTLVFRT